MNTQNLNTAPFVAVANKPFGGQKKQWLSNLASAVNTQTAPAIGFDSDNNVVCEGKTLSIPAMTYAAFSSVFQEEEFSRKKFMALVDRYAAGCITISQYNKDGEESETPAKVITSHAVTGRTAEESQASFVRQGINNNTEALQAFVLHFAGIDPAKVTKADCLDAINALLDTVYPDEKRQTVARLFREETERKAMFAAVELAGLEKISPVGDSFLGFCSMDKLPAVLAALESAHFIAPKDKVRFLGSDGFEVTFSKVTEQNENSDKVIL